MMKTYPKQMNTECAATATAGSAAAPALGSSKASRIASSQFGLETENDADRSHSIHSWQHGQHLQLATAVDAAAALAISGDCPVLLAACNDVQIIMLHSPKGQHWLQQ